MQFLFRCENASGLERRLWFSPLQQCKTIHSQISEFLEVSDFVIVPTGYLQALKEQPPAPAPIVEFKVKVNATEVMPVKRSVTSTIFTVKVEVGDYTGLDVSDINLIMKDSVLEDTKTLRDYGVDNEPPTQGSETRGK